MCSSEILPTGEMEKRDNFSGSVGSNGSVTLLSLLVNYLSFDLQTVSCTCSLKGIVDQTSFEVFRKELSMPIKLSPFSDATQLFTFAMSPCVNETNWKY
jgi:hypothetical protein